MSPDPGFKSPVMSPKIVLLPAPFWPMSVIFAPSRTEKFTSSRMGLVWPYSNDTSSNLTTVLFPDIRRTYSIFAETQGNFPNNSSNPLILRVRIGHTFTLVNSSDNVRYPFLGFLHQSMKLRIANCV